MILIGHSSGGTLAGAYTAAHPEHVAKMVLSSPEVPAPDAPITSMVGRFSLREQLAVYAATPAARALAYTLLQVNPQAAHAFADDAEMDARFDRVYNRTLPALHCPASRPDPRSMVSASTPTITHSPTLAPRARLPSRPRRASSHPWSSRVAATISPGPRLGPT